MLNGATCFDSLHHLAVRLVQLPRGIYFTPNVTAPGRREPFGGGEEFGSFLLSRAKMRSIIGEEELNCRVRNGIGCTLYSVAAKSLRTVRLRAVPALFLGFSPPELPSKYN